MGAGSCDPSGECRTRRHDRVYQKPARRGILEDPPSLCLALGNLASRGSTTRCTQYNADHICHILPGYQEYSAASGYTTDDHGTP
jgi:hypothetical protein